MADAVGGRPGRPPVRRRLGAVAAGRAARARPADGPGPRAAADPTADPAAVVAELRGLVPGAADVAAGVAATIAAVRTGGDAALAELVARHDRDEGEALEPLEHGSAVLGHAADAFPADLRAALALATDNVRAVAMAARAEDHWVQPGQGQRIRLREEPVRRAGVYVPGGRNPYLSSAVMGVATARAAGVAEVVVATPSADPALLAACALAGADRVLRMGGAQAVAALALGTERVPRVDVLVGPGGLWVQEAKRQLAAEVGIDGFAGPSDVLVLATAGADPEPVALDLLAQAEHGAGSLAVLVTPDGTLADAVLARVTALAPDGFPGAAVAVVDVDDLDAGLRLAEAFAPEHLELQGAEAEAAVDRVRGAGCVFCGAAAATAFGDFVVGTNHTLPTGGAARFASGLSVRTFRRLVHEVHLGDAAATLAAPAARIAEAEGFAWHAASLRARGGRAPG